MVEVHSGTAPSQARALSKCCALVRAIWGQLRQVTKITTAPCPSRERSAELDFEVNPILDDARARAVDTLEQHHHAREALAEALIEGEVVDRAALDRLLASGGRFESSEIGILPMTEGATT